MQQLPEFEVSPVIVKQLAARHAASVPHALQVSANLIHLHHLFRDANVEYLTLKGPPLAIRYYGGLEHRHSKDLDLWIAPEALTTAIAALERDGYRCAILDHIVPSQAKHVIALTHHLTFEKAGAIPVELHTRLMQFTHLCNIDFMDAHTAATWIPVAGQRIPSLGPAHLLTYLCVHGATHEWERLKWLADLPRILAALGWDWTDIATAARTTGGSRAIDIAAHLCALVFDQPVPRTSSSRQHFHAPPERHLSSRLAKHALSQLQRPTSRAETSLSLPATLARWCYCAALNPSLSHKMAVLSHVSAPTVADITVIRLPKALYALYFLVRPVSWAWKRLASTIKYRL
jgi:hypothetical protein